MKTFIFMLIMPALIAADINIDVIASVNASERQVHISGSDVAVLSDAEVETFQLTDLNVKNAVKAYYGAKPDDIFLNSPTPWGDLYKTFQWKPVSRVLKPIRAKMSPIQYKRVSVMSKHFINNSTKPAYYKAYMRQEVEDTIASIWETNGVLTGGLNISYGFEFLTMAVFGKASMSYTAKWGENVMKSQSVTVGSDTGLEITLEPGQGAYAVLKATTGEIKIQIDYETSLSGTIAVNYENGYKGHHFHGLDVNSVLNAGGMNATVISSEEIVLGYYSDSEVVVHDIPIDNNLYYNLDPNPLD